MPKKAAVKKKASVNTEVAEPKVEEVKEKEKVDANADAKVNAKYKIEAEGDYIRAQSWLDEAGKTYEDWLNYKPTHLLMERFKAAVKLPAFKMDKDAETEKLSNFAIHRAAIPQLAQWLGNRELIEFLIEAKEFRTYTYTTGGTTIRVHDGFIDFSNMAAQFKSNVADFVATEEYRLITSLFDTQIVGEEDATAGTTTYYGHPVFILPFLMWLDKPSTYELFGLLMTARMDYVPQLDIMRQIREARMLKRAGAALEKETESLPAIAEEESKEEQKEEKKKGGRKKKLSKAAMEKMKSEA